jgi:Zn-dependent protease/CBS domain-containing protein
MDTAPPSRWSIRLTTVRGVDIELHVSIIITLVVIVVTMAEVSLPELVGGYPRPAYWVAAGLAGIAFLTAVLLHELAHAVVAQREGIEVTVIQLWMLGGAAGLGDEPSAPRTEARVAVAGPLLSLLFGGVCGLVAGLVAWAGLSDLVAGTLAWLALLNVLVAVFNLLPVFPLDGGRLLAALLWARSGSRATAIERAARAGGLVGLFLIGLGIIQIAAGAFVAGVWWILLGSFIRALGRAEAEQVAQRSRLAAVRVADVMSPRPEVVRLDSTVDELVDRLLRSRHLAFPVVSATGEVVGLVSIDDVRASGAARTRQVGEIARPLKDVVVVAPGDPAWEALTRLGSGECDRALVVDDACLVGIVAPSDVTRVLSVLDLASRLPGSSASEALRTVGRSR